MAYSREDDVKFLNNPNLWPKWPILPLVNRQKQRSAIVWGDPKPFRVYEVNMWSIPTSKEDWEGVAKHEYKTAEELLDAGWEID